MVNGHDYWEHLQVSDTCVVAFSSNDDYDGRTLQFEFGNVLKAMDVSYVLLRDSTRFRHQYGILGLGDRSKVVDYLIDLRRVFNRLVLVGVSAGSTAALMYGQLMAMRCAPLYYLVGNVEVIVISPYSDLGNPDEAFGSDWHTRGPWEMDNVPLLSDLNVIFDKGPLVKTRAFYSDGDGAEYDIKHARRLKLPDLTFVPGASHSDLGKLMRDKGAATESLVGGTDRRRYAMLTAFIFICPIVALEPECNKGRSIWSAQSPERYSSVEECHEEAIVYLHTVDFDGILESGKDYQDHG